MQPINIIEQFVKAKETGILNFLAGRTVFHKAYGMTSVIWNEMQFRRMGNISDYFNSLNAEQIRYLPERYRKRILTYVKARGVLSSISDVVRTARDYKTWMKAKKHEDFSIFGPALDRIRKRVQKLSKFTQEHSGSSSAYEALLDRLTPGLKISDIEGYKKYILKHKDMLCDNGRAARILEKEYVSGVYALSVKDQEKILRRMIGAFGISEDKYSLVSGEDLHPLCFVKDGHMTITFKYHQNDFMQTALDVLHELGHGLLRVYSPEESRFSFLGLYDTFYNGPDEACALLFEQYIGRSPEFANMLHGIVTEETDKTISYETIAYRLRNDLGSLCRLEAKPERSVLFHLQYYDMERQLIDADLPIQEVEKQWFDLSQKYHGRMGSRLANESILQDPHWMSGELGRFPAGYLVGVLMAAQIFETIRTDTPQALNEIAQGNMKPALDWIVDNVLSIPRRPHFEAFIKEVTGKKLSASPFIRIARKRGYDEVFSGYQPRKFNFE